MTRTSPQRILAASILGVLVLASTVLMACGSEPGWDADGLRASIEDAPFVPTVTNSPNSLGVGQSRIAIALNNEDGSLIADAEVSARFYHLADDPNADPDEAELVTETPLTRRTLDINTEHLDPGTTPTPTPSGSRYEGGSSSMQPVSGTLASSVFPEPPRHEGDLTTIYSAVVDFDRSGWWGIAIDVTVADKTYQDLRMTRFVLEDTPMPGVGDAAVPAEQLTLADVDGDVSQVSTSTEPIDDMLDETITDALGTGKPVVIAFVTPAYCQTRFCGPVLETVVAPAWEQYGDRVEFVHVEPYDLPALRANGQFQAVQAVLDWRLETEPMLYVVDAGGTVVAMIEGITDEAELTAAIETALGS